MSTDHVQVLELTNRNTYTEIMLKFDDDVTQNITTNLKSELATTQKGEPIQIVDDEITLTRMVICVILFVVIVLTMFGNMVVLIAPFIERRLRTTLIYYIMNLALTDLLVAVMAMDFYTIDVLLGYWPFGEVMCGVWIFFDYGMTFASVFTLVVISLDRFWSVQWPIHYKIRNSRTKCIIMISIVWIAMLCMWLPPCIQDRLQNSQEDLCIWEPSDNREFVMVIAILGHHGPCITIVICYIRVFLAMRQRLSRVGDIKPISSAKSKTSAISSVAEPSTNKPSSDEQTNDNSKLSRHANSLSVPGPKASDEERISQQKKRDDRERRSFILLSYVIGSYLFCWVPFHVVFDISAVDPTLVPENVYRTTFWLTYFNSTLNPLLYAYSSKDFRSAFKKIMRCQFRRR